MTASTTALKLAASALFLLTLTTTAIAQTQTPLPGSAIPQFVDPLPTLSDFELVNGADASEHVLTMSEFQAFILPRSFILPNGSPYKGTYVWGYRETAPNGLSPEKTYLGPIVVAQRDVVSRFRFVNNLGNAGDTKVLAYKNSTDQTLHWADPLNEGKNDCAMMGMMVPTEDCAKNYSGSIPAAVHLHGGVVPPELDGGPDAWYTSNGIQGKGYYSADGAAPNEVIYNYPNQQEGSPIWFHDHTLGATRLNVYAGMAGGYLIQDPKNDPQNIAGFTPVPLIIQDRMFDVNGELFYPAGVPFIPNPDHPYWVPEFIGDTIVVNGKTWPYLSVNPQRYRFIIYNGSNARAYELFLVNPVTKLNGPSIYQIGTDGGFLDKPVKIDPNAATLNKLVLLPGERADVIIDFRSVAGQTLILRNTAKTPYPAGATVQGATTGRVMQFRVAGCPRGGCAADAAYDPAGGASLRQPDQQIVRLVNPASGTLAPGVVVSKVRQLTLNEVMGMPMTIGPIVYPGGPLEILQNNTKWMADNAESPDEGSTEIWEIVNLTADAHPIHTHLTQFQLLNRQKFDASKYSTVYAAAFPGGVYQPGFGPPNTYDVPNADGAIGGNPAVKPFLKNAILPPNANEAGWKDTVMALPGQITRFVVRFAPTTVPANATDGAYPFDPSGGPIDAENGLPKYTYVWHCHIIDHEDNEMMSRTVVKPKDGVQRTLVQGVDY